MADSGSIVRGRRFTARSRPAVAAAVTAGTAAVVLALSGGIMPAGAAPAPAPPVAPATSTWAIQPTPNPLIRDGGLTAVSCISPGACIAVGQRRDSTGARVTLAESWNGSAWSVQQTPNPPGVPSSSLVGVSCTSATFCIAVGQTITATGSPPLAEVWNGTTWSIQQTPSVTDAEFSGVSCTSPTACTLVGRTGSQALAEGWNGTSWSVQGTAPGLSTADFAAVSCTSASACTAVGNRGFAVPLAEAWNGTTWSVQRTPASGQFSGVSCTSASACTAVGHNVNSGPLAERWNGTSWSIQAVPGVRGLPTVLESVSCTSPSACTATGYYLPSAIIAPAAEQWNGTAWSVQPVPDPQPRLGTALPGVSCTSASACIAAGEDGAALAEAWNGTSWSVQRITTPPGAATSELDGVSCPAAGACMAVGEYRGNANGFMVPFAERWNGTSWAVLPIPPNPGAPSFDNGSFLTGVSCLSPSACTAVGYFYDTKGGLSTLAEVWNGTTWSIQPTPDQPGAPESVLSRVSCTSATACTAVGYYHVVGSSGGRSTLAEAWNGTSWSIKQTPLRHTTADHTLDGVSCTSARACTAVGHVGGETLAERWNGTRWSLQRTPHADRAHHALFGVSCTSASACTAVGAGYDGFLAESWNGTSWSVQSAPSPPGFAFGGAGSVSCTSAGACSAVVSSFFRTVTERWNGTAWSLEYPPAPGGSHRILGDVSCVLPGGCTAVGHYNGPTGELTLADARP